MELEEMQTLWNELSAKVDQQKILTHQLIVNMTTERYKNKFQKIKTYETIGSIVAAVLVIIVLLNLSKLDTWYLLACGIFTAVYFLLLPPLVLISINRIKNINIGNKNYKETILAFAKAKKNLLLIQRLAMPLNFILMLAVLPVAVKLIDNKDIFATNNPMWYWMIPVMLLLLFVLSSWGYRGYQRSANAAEQLIGELEN